MKTLKIGIADYDRMKARTMAIARGEHKPARGEPTVWFTSIESFAKVLSRRNRELLAMIGREKPGSVTELAEISGRSKSNLSRTRSGAMRRRPGCILIVGEGASPCTRRRIASSRSAPSSPSWTPTAPHHRVPAGQQLALAPTGVVRPTSSTTFTPPRAPPAPPASRTAWPPTRATSAAPAPAAAPGRWRTRGRTRSTPPSGSGTAPGRRSRTSAG